MTELATPSVIKRLLEEHGLSPNKALGQNFIADRNHLAKIVLAAGLSREESVLEIGPGIGALTVEMAARCRRVVSIEIDRGLVSLLHKTCGGYQNVTIIHGDALKVDLREIIRTLSQDSSGVKVVANLPYYITTPLLFRLLDQRELLKSMVLLVQREVAIRLKAPPGDEQYGSLTVAVNYYCDVDVVGTVPPTAFFPQPEVTSAIVRLDVLREPRVAVGSEDLFFKVVWAAFAQRRKNLRNALSVLAEKHEVEDVLTSAGVDWRRRGETLTLQEFARIACSLGSLQKHGRGARL